MDSLGFLGGGAQGFRVYTYKQYTVNVDAQFQFMLQLVCKLDQVARNKRA